MESRDGDATAEIPAKAPEHTQQPPGTQPPPAADPAAPEGLTAEPPAAGPPGPAAPAPDAPGPAAPGPDVSAAGPPGPQPLVRTREPRIIAGVCGGLARATNTDPILFRVILAVLVFFGGVGALLYLLGWLLLPLEGESASPAEALLGRGKSSTKPFVTILLGVGVLIGLMTSLNTGFENVALLVAVVVGVALLLRRAGHFPQQVRSGTPAPAAVAPSAPYPPSYQPAQTYPASATATLQIPTSPPAPAYSSPFAPHGPYVPPSPPSPPIPPVPPRAPRPPRERSILGRVTLALACLAVAGVTIADLAGADVPFTGYMATALGVIALGLLVGTWLGRARLLIPLGIVLSIALGIGAASERIGNYTSFDENVTWAPASYTDLQSEYRHDSGDVTLDLTAVDFTDRNRDVNVKVGAGDLQILLPPNVDVDVTSKVGAGQAWILNGNSEGLGISRKTVDTGADGAGGGTLNLVVELGVGSLEVSR